MFLVYFVVIYCEIVVSELVGEVFMTKIKSVSTLIVSVLMGLPQLAWAEEGESNEIRPYLGFKGGYQWADDDTYDSSKPRDGVFGVFGGLQFTPAWGWDLGYQYHNSLYAEQTDIDVQTSLIETALTYDWWFVEKTSLYGRLGVAYWMLDKTAPGQSDIDTSGFAPLGEVGLRYQATDNIALNLGYQYIDGLGDRTSGEYDSHAVIAGVRWMFGSSTSSVVAAAPVAVAAATTSTPKVTISSEEVHFGFDDSEVGNVDITPIVEHLDAFPSNKAQVVGHTDSTGPEAYNQKLSEKRANNVKKYIELQGIEAERIEVEGRGESEPVADNATKSGRAKNRRVEITIIE